MRDEVVRLECSDCIEISEEEIFMCVSPKCLWCKAFNGFFDENLSTLNHACCARARWYVVSTVRFMTSVQIEGNIYKPANTDSYTGCVRAKGEALHVVCRSAIFDGVRRYAAADFTICVLDVMA